ERLMRIRAIPSDRAIIEFDKGGLCRYRHLFRLSVYNCQAVIDVAPIIKYRGVLQNFRSCFKEIPIKVSEIWRVGHAHGETIQLFVDLVLELRNQPSITHLQTTFE